MNIIWHGQTCFTVNFQKGKEVVSVFFNPLDPETGLKSVKKETDVLILNNSLEKTKTKSFLINNPGEYEIKGVIINGFYSFDNGNVDSNNVIFKIEGENLSVCHLGVLKQPELKKEQVDKIGNVDILFLPIGTNPQEAIKIMSQIKPKITIPMYYQVPKLKEKLAKLDDFLKILGIKSLESLPKFSLKKKDLPQDPQIVVLNP